MITVKSEWEHYKSLVYGFELSETQNRELQKTFYAAFFSALRAVKDGTYDMPEEQVIPFLMGLEQECITFVDAEIKRAGHDPDQIRAELALAQTPHEGSVQ